MKYDNVGALMSKITRHPLMEDIPFETVVEYVLDFIRIVGLPDSFVEKTALLPVKDYRAELPCDFCDLKQLRIVHNVRGHEDKQVGPTFRYSTDNFHVSPLGKHRGDASGLTYKLQGDCLILSIPNGEIEASYLSLPVDDDGLPLIPDDAIYMRALESYVKWQWFTILFDLNKIAGAVMQKAEQDYSWAVGQVQSSLRVPTVDQMESIVNMWERLLPDVRNEHRFGFKYMGNREHLKIH